MAVPHLSAGLLASCGLLRVLSSQPHGNSPTNHGVTSFMVLVMSGIALLAWSVPARRAAKVDPMVAPHHE